MRENCEELRKKRKSSSVVEILLEEYTKQGWEVTG